MSLRPGFRNRFAFDPFYSKRTNNSGSVSTNALDRKIYKTEFPTLQLQFLSTPLTPTSTTTPITPPIFYFPYHFHFFLDTQHLELVTTAVLSRCVLSRCQSPVTCRSRIVGRNFTHKVNYRCYCHCQTWNLYSLLKELDGLPSQWRGDGWIHQIACLLENYIGAVVW